MITETFTLENSEGLHARPAGVFAKMAMNFESEIKVKAKGQEVNAKSIMSMMTLGLDKGDQFSLSIAGSDAEAALAALKKLIEQGIHAE